LTLHPRIGEVAVGDLTAVAVDATYAAPHRVGGMRGQPLPAGTLARVTWYAMLGVFPTCSPLVVS